MGYTDTTAHYRLWNPQSNKVIIATDVEFNENGFTATNRTSCSEPALQEEGELESQENELEIQGDEMVIWTKNTQGAATSKQVATQNWQAATEAAELQPEEMSDDGDIGDTIVLQPRAPEPAKKGRGRPRKHAAQLANGMPEPTKPRSYAEAVGDLQYGKQWKAAIQEELRVLNANSTWRMEKLPYGRKTVSSRWVFKVKKTPMAP